MFHGNEAFLRVLQVHGEQDKVFMGDAPMEGDKKGKKRTHPVVISHYTRCVLISDSNALFSVGSARGSFQVLS
jgi:hypothetical protein